MYLFVDTETTGLPKNRYALGKNITDWPRMVELGWIECETDGSIIAEYDSIIKPDSFIIPDTASAIHGITTKYAQEEGRPLVLVLEQFHKSLDNCSFIVGHNVEFDMNVIAAEALRIGVALSVQLHQRKCTMKSSARLCNLKRGMGYKNPTLAELHHILFGLPVPESHTALNDARACMRCFFELKRRGIL